MVARWRDLLISMPSLKLRECARMEHAMRAVFCMEHQFESAALWDSTRFKPTRYQKKAARRFGLLDGNSSEKHLLADGREKIAQIDGPISRLA